MANLIAPIKLSERMFDIGCRESTITRIFQQRLYGDLRVGTSRETN